MRARRSAEETRSIMVEAGLEMLQRHGIDIGVDSVTLEAACVQKDIARSSSHAAWSIDDRFSPQETFQRAVLEAWLDGREGTLFSNAARTAIDELLSKGVTDSSAIIRGAVEAAYIEGVREAEGDGGDFISTDMAIRYAAASQPLEERDVDVLAWIQASELRNRSARIEDTYRPMGEFLGLEPKPALGDEAYHLYAIAVAALVEGLSLRTLIVPGYDFLASIEDESDPSISAIGACVEALIPVFFQKKSEPDDEASG